MNTERLKAILLKAGFCEDTNCLYIMTANTRIQFTFLPKKIYFLADMKERCHCVMTNPKKEEIVNILNLIQYDILAKFINKNL